jgi:tetratricopeptide (TPR) repeat protein
MTRLPGAFILAFLVGAMGAAQQSRTDPALEQIGSLIQQDRLDEAKAATEQAIQRNPSSVEAYNLLGMIEGDRQDFAGAETAFQKALQLKPGSTKTHNNLGNLYLVEKRPELAEKEFRTVLRLDAANSEGHHNLGVLMMMKGSPAAAIAQFRQVHPSDQSTRLQLVRAYFENKQPAEALRTAAELSAENEKNIQVHFSLGVLLGSEKQYKAAQREMEKADALQPGTFEILYNLGEDMLRSGDNSGAEAVLQRALHAKPDSAETLYLAAQVYANESRPLDALDLLVRARKLAPQNVDILFLMAQVSMSQNYFEDAIPLLESGVEMAPRRPDLMASLGESYFMAGKVEKAIDEFNRLIEVEGSARSHAFLGLTYRNMGRFDEAKQQFDAGLKIDPKNSLCLFNLGYIAERQGDAADAERYFQQSLASNPDFADALLELANLRIAARKFPEAESLLRHYVRVSQNPATGYYKLAMVERSLHDAAAADRDLNVFKTLSRTASVGPLPYQHLFDYLDNRAKLPSAERNQLDFDQLTSEVKQHPDQPEDLYLLAEACLKSGKVDEAKDAIAQLDKIGAGDFRTLTGTGVLLARYRLYDGAIEHFQAALKANPDSDEVKFDLADALFRARRYAEALDAAGRLSAAGQKDDAYLALLGDIYAHLGDATHASEIYRSAIGRNPDNDQDYLSLALIQLRAGDLSAAKKTLRDGQSRIPGSGKIFWGLGLVSALEGNNAEAGEQLERAVDLLPEWPGGYSTLGVFYFQSGQIDKAREVLNRFRNSSASGTLDIGRIEQVLDQAALHPAPAASMSETDRAQFLQLALSLADRTL